MLTQSKLKERLHYCPDTGIFTWIKLNPQARNLLVGIRAGSFHVRGYRQICVDNKSYTEHRLAFLYVEGVFPEHQVDHINQSKGDNRWANLRHATQTKNSQNCPLRKDNTSGALGVRWNGPGKKWSARITVCKKPIFLGYYDDIADAVAARKAANIKYGFHENHGRRLNPPSSAASAPSV